MEIIEAGEKLLNLYIPKATKELIVENSIGSISVLQEICLCIFKKRTGNFVNDEVQINSSELHIYSAIDAILKNYDAAFLNFIIEIRKVNSEQTIEYYKTIVYCILTTKTSILRYGVQLQEIFTVCKNALPSESVNIIELHQALKDIKDFQIANKVIPPFLEYDEGEKLLHVTDKFFLLWLASKKKSELLENAQFEIDWILRSKWISLY
jgi:hypothetical protein